MSRQLTEHEIAERATKLCNLHAEIERADEKLETAKKQHKATVSKLAGEIAGLRREIETGRAEEEQLTINEAIDAAADQAELEESVDLGADTAAAVDAFFGSESEAAVGVDELEAATSGEGELVLEEGGEEPEEGDDSPSPHYAAGFEARLNGEGRLNYPSDLSLDDRQSWLAGWKDADAELEKEGDEK